MASIVLTTLHVFTHLSIKTAFGGNLLIISILWLSKQSQISKRTCQGTELARGRAWIWTGVIWPHSPPRAGLSQPERIAVSVGQGLSFTLSGLQTLPVLLLALADSYFFTFVNLRSQWPKFQKCCPYPPPLTIKILSIFQAPLIKGLLSFFWGG